MPGSLVHSPADIIRHLLIDLGHGRMPPDKPWPIFADFEPGSPDNCITVINTQGRNSGRTHIDGERQEHHGIQVRLRTGPTTIKTAFLKIREIAVSLDQDVLNTIVVIENNYYRIQTITRVGDTIFAGKMREKEDMRLLYTINALVMVRQLEANDFEEEDGIEGALGLPLASATLVGGPALVGANVVYPSPASGPADYVEFSGVRLRANAKFSAFFSFKLAFVDEGDFCLAYRGDDVGQFESDAANASATNFTKTEVAISCQTQATSPEGNPDALSRILVVLPGRDAKNGHIVYIACASKLIEIPTNDWQTVGVVYNGSNKRTGINIYHNGLPVKASHGVANSSKGLTAASPIVATNALRAFYQPGTGGSFAGGTVERITFWDKALSTKAMADLHDAQALLWG